MYCWSSPYTRGHQVRSWRAGVPAEFSSNPNQTHLKQLIKVLTGILETSRQVCWGKLELNSAGHRPSRTEFDDPCLTLTKTEICHQYHSVILSVKWYTTNKYQSGKGNGLQNPSGNQTALFVPGRSRQSLRRLSSSSSAGRRSTRSETWPPHGSGRRSSCGTEGVWGF